MTEVIVIGGGVMGSAAARQLTRHGARVTLLEQYQPGHVLGGSHGSSRIFRLAYPEAEYAALSLESLPLWRQLERETGAAILDRAGALDHGAPTVIASIHNALITIGAPYELLDPDQAAQRWPGLRFDTAVIYHPGGGQLHADRAVTALKASAVAGGATVRHDTTVTAVESLGDRGVRVHTGTGGTLTADAVVLAAGAWTPRLLPDLGLPTIVVTQEQPAHFTPRDKGTGWPSFIHHTAAVDGTSIIRGYGLGSEDGIKVGFHARGPIVTADPGQRDLTVSAEAIAELQAYTRFWVPGVDADTPRPLTCLYDLTPDHDFIVDRVGPVTVLAGFSGHGFKFAPAIGELAARLVLDGASTPDRFRLDRPRQPLASGPARPTH